MSALRSPIHTEEVGGHPVRFFHSPETQRSGQPDMPWHVCDDLWRALGIEPEGREVFLRRLRADWWNPETVATAEGPVVIAPYLMGDILIDEWLSTMGVPDADDRPSSELRLRGSFRRGNTAALKAMTPHLGGMGKLAFALEAMENMDNLKDKWEI